MPNDSLSANALPNAKSLEATQDFGPAKPEAKSQSSKPYGHDSHGGHASDAHDEHGHERGDIVLFGFWLYIMSDCLLFGTLFAMYAVLGGNLVNQVDPKSVLDLKFVAVETALLLVSSFTFGMAMLGAYVKDLKRVGKWLAFTWLLGAGFLCMELYEFRHLFHVGASPQSGGHWSSFFALLGTHGMHVFAGLIWMILLFFLIRRDGLNEDNMIRLSCLSVFWHFLDIIWICVFSFVYLIGALS